MRHFKTYFRPPLGKSMTYIQCAHIKMNMEVEFKITSLTSFSNITFSNITF